MSNGSEVDEEDRLLFRNEIGEIKRVDHNQALPAKPRPKAKPRQTIHDEIEVLHQTLTLRPSDLDVETGDDLSFIRPGMQNRQLLRLRRGQIAVEAELDLHGLTLAVALPTLDNFLKQCRRRGVRCVRIVHGKGLGSKHGKPVLKTAVNAWLQRTDQVMAFCSAPLRDGGTGALYVLLSR